MKKIKRNLISKNINTSIRLFKKHFKLLPKLIWMFDRVIFAADIPYKANIDPSVRWGHNGLGTVVNIGSSIGADSLIMQGVSIAGSLGKVKEVDGKIITSPQIGRHTLIGAGATLLGPIIIGDDVIIGAGAVVTTDIPSGSVAVGVPAKIIGQASKEDLAQY